MPSPKEHPNADGTTTWRVRLRDGTRNTSETFATELEASNFCALVEELRRTHGPAGASLAIAERNRRDSRSDGYMPTVREMFEEHLTGLVSVEPGTLTEYRSTAERVMLPLLGALPVDLITRDRDAEFIKRLRETPVQKRKGRKVSVDVARANGWFLSPKTISQHHGLLSSVMRSAVINGHISTNPCYGARMPRQGEEDREDARFLTHAEYARLEAQTSGQGRALVRTLVGTGLRWSEATALQVRDVDLHGGSLRVVRAWKRPAKGAKRRLGPPKSAKSRRTVMLGSQIVDALRAQVEGQPPEAFVFRNTKGGALYSGPFHERVWQPACIAAGLDPRPRIHDLRHSHASWLIEQGCSLEQVQDQLGHENIGTTRKIYGHLQPAMRAAVSEASTRMMTLALQPASAPVGHADNLALGQGPGIG